MTLNQQVHHNTDKKKEITNIGTSNFPYRELIGWFPYLSVRSRSDISRAVNEASMKIENSTQHNKRRCNNFKENTVILKRDMIKGIMYRRGENITKPEAYCDSDYANCVETRCSTTGFVIMLAVGPISWCFKGQPIVSHQQRLYKLQLQIVNKVYILNHF